MNTHSYIKSGCYRFFRLRVQYMIQIRPKSIYLCVSSLNSDNPSLRVMLRKSTSESFFQMKQGFSLILALALCQIVLNALVPIFMMTLLSPLI